MAMMSKTRNMLEGFVQDGSFRWLIKTRGPFDEEIEEMKRSPSADRNWLPELSPVANIIVRRCAKILNLATSQLREDFDREASDTIKHPSGFARNFLEYSCFRALALSTQVDGYLEEKKFRRLTYDMMLAWESPSAVDLPSINVDEDATVGLEAFSRIAPAVPIIANIVVSDYIFEVLAASSGGRLQFSIYEKYLGGLGRAVKKLKTQSESSLLSSLRSATGERILEVDGTVTTQPVLQHVGISTWPGRLTLTDHALYFEPLRVVSYDKPTVYDLSTDLKQIVKPELTGPWGTRLFDKAVLYKSMSLSEPVIMELPELKGHTRRDYWLALIREILYAHQFLRKFQITGVEKEEALVKAIFGILRVQALKEMSFTIPLSFEALLMFNVCDQLPGGDLILETLANMPNSRELDRTNDVKAEGGMYSISALAMASNLGFVFGASSSSSEAGIVVGELSVGEMTPLEKAVKESRSSYRNVVVAQATVDGVKVEGIDTNLAVMKELLVPLFKLGSQLLKLLYWEDPLKSFLFCLVFAYIIFRGWLRYAFALLLVFFAVFVVLTWCLSEGRQAYELKVTTPLARNPMEQLLSVQNAISQAEELIQDGNIFLLKFRALLFSIFPQASARFVSALLAGALVVAFVPMKHVFLFVFVEEFTKYSPVRRASTEKWTRRMREWWFSIPAAPVLLKKAREDKKRK